MEKEARHIINDTTVSLLGRRNKNAACQEWRERRQCNRTEVLRAPDNAEALLCVFCVNPTWLVRFLETSASWQGWIPLRGPTPSLFCHSEPKFWWARSQQLLLSRSLFIFVTWWAGSASELTLYCGHSLRKCVENILSLQYRSTQRLLHDLIVSFTSLTALNNLFSSVI